MLIVYSVDFGVTSVIVPSPLQKYLGLQVELGALYYAYMAAIAIFCPNSINILAGVNGVEVTQSLVIAGLLVLNSSLYVFGHSAAHPALDSHLFSLVLLLPFIGVSLALWYHNRYPAKVFVGDTYCYFAGMVFAVVGILGHFSKTLLLLFVPQMFNFAYSAPQLFGLIPCPRHRLPKFNARSGLLEPSVTRWERPPSRLQALLLTTLERTYLLRLERNDKGQILQSSNFTILNLWLVWSGPLREDQLVHRIILLQTCCGLVGLLVRHKLALFVFPSDNRAFAGYQGSSSV